MSNIFNTEFYPTPDSVTRQMVAPYLKKLNKLQILEPSAGSGSILDCITKGIDYYSARKENVYAIEQDPELTYIYYRVRGTRSWQTTFFVTSLYIALI